MSNTPGPLCKSKLLSLGIINHHLKRAAPLPFSFNIFIQSGYFKNHNRVWTVQSTVRIAKYVKKYYPCGTFRAGFTKLKLILH